jgi:hypothetical protein
MYGMDLQEKERLKQQAELEYRQRLVAIDSVWEMAQKIGLTNGVLSAPLGKTNRVHRIRAKNAGRGHLLKAVRKVIKTIDQPFTSLTVFDAIQKEFPGLAVKRSSLKGTLKKLYETEELAIEREGRGRRPTEYKRV